jgi:hypothetical protein
MGYGLWTLLPLLAFPVGRAMLVRMLNADTRRPTTAPRRHSRLPAHPLPAARRRPGIGEIARERGVWCLVFGIGIQRYRMPAVARGLLVPDPRKPKLRNYPKCQ